VIRSRQASAADRYDRRVGDEPSIEIIPLFPLSNVVLFPRVHCPLHIFEPRYRQMTADALDGARRIGMTTVRPEHRSDMAGDPPLFSIGCAGTIQQARQRADGRYDIVLFGTQRFRILDEPPRDGERLYRLARVELLDERFDEAREGIPLQGLRADAIDLLSQLLRFVAPENAHAVDPRRFSGIDDTAFVSALCQMLELPPAEKQGLLEADGPLRRCERLVAILEFRIAERLGGMPGPSGAIH
jgi:Lon protease-like protein